LNPLDVCYTDSFHKLNFHKQPNDAIFNMIYTKSFEWNYEQELRILETDLKDQTNRKLHFNKSTLKSVYIGLNSEVSTTERIVAIINKNYRNAQIYQAFKDANAFKIVFRKID